jgi:hypothetical protein
MEEIVAIGSMSLAAGLIAWLGFCLWWDQRELRRKTIVEMMERRINGQ